MAPAPATTAITTTVVIPKPRLRTAWGIWICMGAGLGCIGNTPRAAYQRWRLEFIERYRYHDDGQRS